MTGRIVIKRGWFWSGLGWILRILTLGKVANFSTGYLTTIGPIIGVPEGYDASAPWNQPDLVHERWHIRQQEQIGLGSAWVGLVPWGLAYLFLPLPIGLAWARYALERSAYAQGYRVRLDLMRRDGASPTDVQAERRRLTDEAVRLLTGAPYLWAWPFPRSVRRWFEVHL